MKNTTVDVLLKVGRLKSIKRTGWVRSGMPDPESVAAHTFRVCFLVLVLADRLKLNRQKLLEMGLLHDIEEAVTGDPVTQRGMDQIGEHDVEEEGNIVDGITTYVTFPKSGGDFIPTKFPGNTPQQYVPSPVVSIYPFLRPQRQARR